MFEPKNRYIILICSLLVASLWCSKASAISVAVFPVDDLSMQHNSINDEMGQFLVNEIDQRGLEIISLESTKSYMNEKNIKQLGQLETKEIMATREALGADLIVLASLCQKGQRPTSIGMTVQLIRTSDGKTIWSNTSGLSLGSEQKLLGVDMPKTLEDLKPILASKLFDGWPNDLDFTAGRKMAGAQIAAVSETTMLEVDSAFFSPKIVQPGQKVKCTIRFKSTDQETSKATVFIKVGNRVHLASTSDNGKSFSAAWVGSGTKTGASVQVASNENDSQVLNQMLNVEVIDADYPVSLILDWPSGKRDESFLGSYIVDSRSPEVFFKLRGEVVDGVISFRGDLPIGVRYKRHEPIKKWEFMVANEKGETVLRERGSGMPPDFKWRGQNNKNLRADAGLYLVSLKVWDRAGNEGVASEKVRLLKSRPEVAINLEKHDNKDVVATLTSLDRVPVKSWRMELWSSDNQLLKTYRGESLPVKFKLPVFADSVDIAKIACILSVVDDLGGKSFNKSKNIFAQIISSSETNYDENKSEETSTESNDWYADF